jgi:phosphomannomutase
MGKIFSALAKRLPIKLFPIFFKVDGNFPNRDPDPGKNIGLDKLKQTVVGKKADLGLAFDPDGDRIFVIDENGTFVPGTLTIALMSEHLLGQNPQAVILYNVTTGKAVLDVIDKFKACGIMTPVGHAKIKQLAKKYHADFAGEAQSGHFYFKKNFYADNGLIFACILMELLSLSDQTLSALIKPYQKYHLSGEINTVLKNQEQAKEKIKKLKQKYQDGKMLDIDGVRVDYKNWWFGVRISNTEALLRLNVEAKSRELMENKRNELLELIRE